MKLIAFLKITFIHQPVTVTRAGSQEVGWFGRSVWIDPISEEEMGFFVYTKSLSASVSVYGYF